MTFRSNHSTLRPSAKQFTSVGLILVSIGPAIRIMERGTARSRTASSRETAANTGTVG